MNEDLENLVFNVLDKLTNITNDIKLNINKNVILETVI